MPYDRDGNVTLESVAKALTRILSPYYKGFPDPRTQRPEFRKTLTGEETQDLLLHIHVVLTSIRLAIKEERTNRNAQQEGRGPDDNLN